MEDIPFYAAVGRMISAWSGLEFIMSKWFVSLLSDRGSPKSGALQLVFGSGRNFNTKRDLLASAIDGSSFEDEVDGVSPKRDFLKRALARASSYSSFRNKVAHDQYYMFSNGIVTRMQIRPTKELWLSENSISQIEIELATQRIIDLYNIMLAVFAGGSSPEEGLSLVSQLPSEADSPPTTGVHPKTKRRGRRPVRHREERT